MKILFDVGVPKGLRQHLPNHEVTRVQELGWERLRNGELLRAAEKDFDVLLTTDSNIRYQQRLPDYQLALIVLRAFRNSEKRLLPVMPRLNEMLKIIQPGDCVYLYADEFLERKDRRKGRQKN
ncbi:MAG TPA: DUF5615 family PIN-like protein [Blastocatellia bacterium]|nr:DUF5615 family PIN-like protein [Blastocatellia bacterium]